MNIFRSKLLFLTAMISFSAVIWSSGDVSGLPDYLKRASRTRDQLSMSVEKKESNSTQLQMLDDLSFNAEVDTESVAIKKSQKSLPQKQEKPSKKLDASRELVNVKKKAQKQEEKLISKLVDKEKQEIESDELPGLSTEEEQKVEEKEEESEEVVFNFENADLSNLVSYIESLFDVTFITDDAISPMAKGGKGIAGNKISFKTSKPLSRKQAWTLFLTFLDMAGLSVVKQADPTKYRIRPTVSAKKDAIQSFIGIDSELLPDNDTKIRYVYFVKDTPVATLKSIMSSLKSSMADIIILQELKAFIITDNSYNIKSLMRIIRELDKVSMPQSMSVVKLRRVDAAHVKSLYDSLVTPAQQQRGSRLFGPRKPTSSLYFPENARIIVEPRTNSLILLGTRDDIKKIEDFIVNSVDVDAGTPYSPLHVHQLKYADAATVAEIMNGVTRFGSNTTAARTGGVRGADKYLKAMSFTPEPTGNRLVIRGEYDDYLKAKEIIEKLDEPQPQVAVEVLILSIGITDIKELGAQIRNSPRDSEFHGDGLFGKNINFQTSGIRLGSDPKAIVERPNTSGAKRLLGDLISLVTGSTAGNTILSLGSDDFGVWGIFAALKTVSNLQVISNPFLMATNKTKATVSLGEIRNVQTATIKGTTSDTATFSDKEAKLQVEITPQINSDGMIVLKLKVNITEFRDDTVAAVEAAARTEKIIDTSTIVADKEVLALGGLIKNKVENGVNKTPVLGNIPILGWLFKNKKKSETKEDLLILLSARIIDPRKSKDVDEFTSGHIGDYKSTIKQMRNVHLRRDPIDRAFFEEEKGTVSRRIDKLIFNRDKKAEVKKKKKTKKQRRLARRRKRKEERRKKEKMVVADGGSRRKRRKARRKAGKVEKKKDEVVVTAQKVDDVVNTSGVEGKPA